MFYCKMPLNFLVDLLEASIYLLTKAFYDVQLMAYDELCVHSYKCI